MQSLTNQQKEPQEQTPKNIATLVTISWIFFLMITVVTVIYYFMAQPELPLFYTLANKQDQLTAKIFLFLFPIISLTINAIHSLVLKKMHKYSILLLTLFAGTTLVLQALISYSLLRIISVTL